MSEDHTPPEQKSPLQEIVQPFIDLAHSPRALWGVNLGYLIEGMVYFGMLGYLAMYFNEYVGLDDVWAGRMVGCLTAGITISMFFLGGLADRWGVRIAILLAFCCMFLGRLVLSAAPGLGLGGGSIGSSLNLVACLGMLFVVIGYGMYQPAAYAAVRQFTTSKNSGMAYAMLYALMNLGGWLPTFAFFLRNDEYLGLGISGTFWVYTGFTILGLFVTYIILTKKIVADATASAKAEREEEAEAKVSTVAEKDDSSSFGADAGARRRVPLHLWMTILVFVACVYFIPLPSRNWVWYSVAALTLLTAVLPVRRPILRWLANHPLADGKFYFFIFCLIPVQTLFAHNWLTLPMYVERAYRESWPWISKNFEPAVNFNPLLIFVLVPIVTALTQKRKVYNMMILGTFIMAAPTFLLAFGATPWTLIAYLLIMTAGEAMWQPRFLQYAAEIAPEGRTGAYMGVAQFPWFLTKVIVPIYSGVFLKYYCPREIVIGPYPGFPMEMTLQPLLNSESMWLIYASIAMVSSVVLVIAKPWVGKDFKTTAS